MMVTEADAEDRLVALADDEVGIEDAFYEHVNEHGSPFVASDAAWWFNGAKWAFAKARAAIEEATQGGSVRDEDRVNEARLAWVDLLSVQDMALGVHRGAHEVMALKGRQDAFEAAVRASERGAIGRERCKCGHEARVHISPAIDLDIRIDGDVCMGGDCPCREYRAAVEPVEEARRDGDGCAQCGLPPSAHVPGLSYVGAHAFKPAAVRAEVGPQDTPFLGGITMNDFSQPLPPSGKEERDG